MTCPTYGNRGGGLIERGLSPNTFQVLISRIYADRFDIAAAQHLLVVNHTDTDFIRIPGTYYTGMD